MAGGTGSWSGLAIRRAMRWSERVCIWGVGVVFEIPERFNKNSLEVRKLGTQAETGAWLIDYICKRINITDLSGIELLDFGCGCRFTDAILNHNLPIGSYTGIDLDQDLINYFDKYLDDPRFSFSHWDVANPNYNPDGAPLTATLQLPIDDKQFDLICMWSVMTHQLPAHAEAIFTILRRYIKPNGFMFFSAKIIEGEDYAELRPFIGGLSAYSMDAMARMLCASGWRINSFELSAESGLPNQDSFVCTPIS